MISILLCDDDEEALDRISRYIASVRLKIKYEFNIICYKNTADVLKRLNVTKGHNDILLLDIDMPFSSGLEMAKLIRDAGIDIIIIFVTAHAEYVFQSFEYSPFRYIRKEFMEIELLPAIQAACDKISAESYVSLMIKTQEGVVSIRTSDILYYELENRRCVIHTIENKKYSTWKNIKEMRDEMKEYDDFFIQVYRGCMVNKRYVKTIKSKTIVLENEIEIPVSRQKRKEISDIMMNYWAGIV